MAIILTTESTHPSALPCLAVPGRDEFTEWHPGQYFLCPQAEQMVLSKEHGVNPMAGCLPMLLQMPIWIVLPMPTSTQAVARDSSTDTVVGRCCCCASLHRMLSSAGEIYLQPFIPDWIHDLIATDPYDLLPGMLFVSMFLQARLQPALVDSTQQKFLQDGTPILFGGMALFDHRAQAANRSGPLSWAASIVVLGIHL